MLDENAHLKCVWWVLSLVWFYPHFPMVRVISIVSWQCCGSSHRAPKARMVDVRDLITRWFRNKRLTNKYNVGPPSHVSWCINPHNYSYLRTINHSEIGVICTNLAILGASHCRFVGWSPYSWSGWWYTYPSEKYESNDSNGINMFPIYGFQTTNQLMVDSQTKSRFRHFSTGQSPWTTHQMTRMHATPTCTGLIHAAASKHGHYRQPHAECPVKGLCKRM